MSTAKKNLAAALYGVNDLRLEERPIPVINDDQVLIAMQVVGICGSDVHFLQHGRIGRFVVKDKMVLGHEGAGIIAQIGKNVTGLSVGDRVAIEMGVPCSKCRLCRRGKYNLCPCVIFGSAPPHDGCLQNYFVHYPEFCYKLSDNMLIEHGALMEPLSVGVHACRRAKIQLGSMVAIFGAGPIGLSTLLVAKNVGASKVLIVDLAPNRLKLAKELGADLVLEIKKTDTEDEIVRKIHELLGEAPDRTLDCSGSEATNRLSILACANGGIAVVVGNGPLNVNLPLMNALMREVDIRGIFRYTDTYPAARSLIESGKADAMKLVTHKFSIEDLHKAFETSRLGLDGAIKVLIYLQPQEIDSKKRE